MMIMNADEMLNRNMQIVHQKEIAGIKFGKFGKQKPRVIIITCMSPWVDPADIFGLMQGDAYIIRNAGNIITQDTVRCVLLAMMKDKITDVIVLGHLGCTNADRQAVTTNYQALADKIPQASKYRELLGSETKAMKYFMIYQSEIDNVIAQVENLRFFKTIRPSINITGMLYNDENSLVYSFSEIKELKKLMENEFPSSEKISKIIPKRYKTYIKEQNNLEKSEPKADRIQGSTQAKYKPVKRPKEKIEENSNNEIPSPESAEESVAIPVESEVPVTTPSVMEPVAENKEIKAMIDSTQKNLESMQKVMQKSLVKVTGVHVFMPKFRAPVVRIAGVKVQTEKQE